MNDYHKLGPAELSDFDAVVTGIGVLTPAGANIKHLWDSIMLAEGTAAQRLQLTLTDAVPDAIGCLLDEASQAQIDALPKQFKRRAGRATQIAIACALAAVDDANIEDLSEADVYLGSAGGCLGSAYRNRDTLIHAGLKRVTPFAVPMALASAISGDVAQHFGCHGEVHTVATACASGASGIAQGVKAIQSGQTSVALVGGSDAPVIDSIVGGFTRLQALATGSEPERASRPFDQSRNGFVLSEGGAVLVMESRRHAEERGAQIYATISGVASTNDAYSTAAPDTEATYSSESIRRALRHAGRAPQDVASVVAHGTSTVLNDEHETKAFTSTLGDRPDLIVTAPKGVTGHMLGGSAAVETVLAILSIKHGVVPPTANLTDPIPGLNFAGPQGTKLARPVVLSTSFGFGGFNVSIIVESPERR